MAEERLKDAFWLSHRVLLAAPGVVDQVAALIRSAV
jgi:hypothetical protein